MIAGGPNQVSSKVVAIESDKGLARIQFDSIRVELAIAAGLAGDRGLGARRRLQQRQALPR